MTIEMGMAVFILGSVCIIAVLIWIWINAIYNDRMVKLREINMNLIKKYNAEKVWGIELKVADSKKQLIQAAVEREIVQPKRRGK